MSWIVRMLEGSDEVPTTATDCSFSKDETKIKAMRKHFMTWEAEEPAETSTRNFPTEALFPSSSTYARDPYPVLLDADYWNSQDRPFSWCKILVAHRVSERQEAGLWYSLH